MFFYVLFIYVLLYICVFYCNFLLYLFETSFLLRKLWYSSILIIHFFLYFRSNVGHSLSSGTTHISLGARTLDGSVVRTGPSHSSSITIAKPINISQPIVQHLQQVTLERWIRSVWNLNFISLYWKTNKIFCLYVLFW